MNTFPHVALLGLEKSLNTHATECTHLFRVDLDLKYAVLTAQESAHDTLCVHLLADGTGSTLVVGNPSMALRVGTANFLASVAQHWHFVGFPTEGVRAAAVDCYDGVEA